MELLHIFIPDTFFRGKWGCYHRNSWAGEIKCLTVIVLSKGKHSMKLLQQCSGQRVPCVQRVLLKQAWITPGLWNMAEMLLQTFEFINKIDGVTAASSNTALLTHRLSSPFNPVLFNLVQFKPVLFKVVQFTQVPFTPVQFKPVLFKLVKSNSIQLSEPVWFSWIKSNGSIPVGPALSSTVTTYRLFCWDCRSNIYRSHMSLIWSNWTWTNWSKWSIRSIWSNWSICSKLSNRSMI